MKNDLKDFYNDGFGWVCRQCERDLAPPEEPDQLPRLLREGESEGKDPQLSNLCLARWEDVAQRVLGCPRCGVTELAEKS